jgi:hypothetical protein
VARRFGANYVLVMSDERGIQFQEDAVCEVCGRYGAYAFEGKTLCAECYESSGSCCPEFEKESDKADERTGD